MACYTETSKQDKVDTVKNLDIVFVTDTSGSLDDERSAIADGISSFVAQLPGDMHYHIGVMLGHGSTSSHSGRLWHNSNDAVTMDSDSMTLRQIQNHLKTALTTGPGDNDTDGGEETLYSFNKGITENLADIRSKGIFREDAALAVIFITDENDICYPGTVPDPDGKEIPAYMRDCKGITAENILANVKKLQGDRPFLLSGIVYTDPANIPKNGGEDEIGRGILDLVKLSNGALADIGKGHFDQSLGAIGKLTTSKLTLKTEFILGHTKVDPGSIKVMVDGKTVPFTFQAGLNEVQLKASDAGMLNSVISIYYCVMDGSQPYYPPTANTPNTPTTPPAGNGQSCDKNDDKGNDWDKGKGHGGDDNDDDQGEDNDNQGYGNH